MLDVAWGWVGSGGSVDDHLWAALCDLTEATIENWTTPDHGIWEVRTPGRPFTYSVALCAVAVAPVLAAWGAGEVPLQEYPAGSAGPAGRVTAAGGRSGQMAVPDRRPDARTPGRPDAGQHGANAQPARARKSSSSTARTVLM
ncbi:glycoside hydrolase family 15 protein [Geodermatophilus sp. SYSU D00696]